MKIEEGKELIMENVLSLRKKMTRKEINKQMIKIEAFCKEMLIMKNGNVVTTTFGGSIVNGEQVFDIKILIPLDRKRELPKEYIFKDD